MDLKLLLDRLYVKADCIEADVKFSGSGLVVVAFDQQFQQTHLMRSKVVVGAIWWTNLTKQADHAPSDLGRHRRATVCRFADAIQQTGGRRFLQEVTTRARTQCLEDAIVIIVNSEHQNTKRRKLLLEPAHAFDTIHSRQADIGEHDLG